MAIGFRGSVANAAKNGGNVALDLSTISGLAENDLVIVAYSIGDDANTDFTMAIATGSGWTKIVDIHVDGSNDDCDLGVFWKKMGGTPDTSVTVSGEGDTGTVTAGVAMAFSGVDTTTPFDVTTTTATGSGAGNADPPSIDFDDASAWVVAAVASAHVGGAGATFTAASGYTTDFDQDSENDTTDSTCGMGYNSSPSDPENPGTFTHSASAAGNSWCAATMALRPQAAVLDTAKNLLLLGVG